jgi:hypothetical protein
MVDSSWDNSGRPAPKKGISTGMKVLTGCGIALLLVLVTCVVGGAVLGTYIRKDPRAFEARIEGFAQGFVQRDWERFRNLMEQLRTDEGVRTVYRANPGLRQAQGTEEQFLQSVRAWRPRLGPLPQEAPVGGHRRHRRGRNQPEEAPPASDAPGPPSVDMQKIFGTTRIRCTYPDGTRFSATFDGSLIKSLEME